MVSTNSSQTIPQTIHPSIPGSIQTAAYTHQVSGRIKDPVSALTHLIGCIAAILFTPVLLIHASSLGAEKKELVSLLIFMISMISLYASSTSYHSFKLQGEAMLKLKRLDHTMIFVLIAGTYTPICICAMGHAGIILLCVIWGIAFAGICFKLLWVTCPKWISSVIYITMGWTVVFAMPYLIPAVSKPVLIWLYTGGIIYTIGGIIYALKLIRFNSRDSLWGSHEIFHLFVMAGSVCHFISVYNIF